MFDRAANHPSWFVNRVLAYFRRAKSLVTAVPGNHDLIGHNLRTFHDNTLATLSYLSNFYVHVEAATESDGAAFYHFTPFGMQPLPPEPRKKNILALHEPVFEDTVPFYMPDALTVEQLEAKYPGYDLYLAGDIHIPCQKSKTLVSGSMMRMTVAQKEHRPRFYVIDSETLETETVYIPINEDVWADTTEVVEDEGFKAELKDLALAMEERGENLDYQAVVEKLSGDHWHKFDGLINEYKSKMEK